METQSQQCGHRCRSSVPGVWCWLTTAGPDDSYHLMCRSHAPTATGLLAYPLTQDLTVTAGPRPTRTWSLALRSRAGDRCEHHADTTPRPMGVLLIIPTQRSPCNLVEFANPPTVPSRPAARGSWRRTRASPIHRCRTVAKVKSRLTTGRTFPRSWYRLVPVPFAGKPVPHGAAVITSVHDRRFHLETDAGTRKLRGYICIFVW